MNRKKKSEDKINIGYYVVGFIDLLGQQDRLRSLRSLPDESDENQMKTFIEDLKLTYGVVTGMRGIFEKFFTSYSNKRYDLNKTNYNLLTTAQKKIYKQLKNNPINIKSFSDSIIVFTSLRTDKVKLPTGGIWGIFTAAASTALVSLAAGHPIRGGIDVGLGMEIKKGEIYGPCLSRAYSLESKIAGYPRIVVGKECLEYLHDTANQKQQDIISKVCAGSANECLKLLTIDDDGCAVIDYLGDFFLNKIGMKIEKDIIDKAYDKVIQFSEKYRNEGNTKIAFKYTLLRNYMENRLNQVKKTN
jgi:hypothetical protein